MKRKKTERNKTGIKNENCEVGKNKQGLNTRIYEEKKNRRKYKQENKANWKKIRTGQKRNRKTEEQKNYPKVMVLPYFLNSEAFSRIPCTCW